MINFIKIQFSYNNKLYYFDKAKNFYLFKSSKRATIKIACHARALAPTCNVKQTYFVRHFNPLIMATYQAKFSPKLNLPKIQQKHLNFKQIQRISSQISAKKFKFLPFSFTL